jgi:hypothetical protein
MRIATVRPDGWPQTTTVGYANGALTLYFLCAKESQKAANLALDDRVSLAIDDDAAQVMQIKGLSMAAHARRDVDEAEGAKALGLLFARYPAQEGVTFAFPSPEDVAIFRVTLRSFRCSTIRSALHTLISSRATFKQKPPVERFH